MSVVEGWLVILAICCDEGAVPEQAVVGPDGWLIRAGKDIWPAETVGVGVLLVGISVVASAGGSGACEELGMVGGGTWPGTVGKSKVLGEACTTPGPVLAC